MPGAVLFFKIQQTSQSSLTRKGKLREVTSMPIVSHLSGEAIIQTPGSPVLKPELFLSLFSLILFLTLPPEKQREAWVWWPVDWFSQKGKPDHKQICFHFVHSVYILIVPPSEEKRFGQINTRHMKTSLTHFHNRNHICQKFSHLLNWWLTSIKLLIHPGALLPWDHNVMFSIWLFFSGSWYPIFILFIQQC